MNRNYLGQFKWRYALLFLALAAGFIIFRVLNPSIDFVYYEPSYLPPNVSIKAKRIIISPAYTQVDQTFRTEDWVYSIGEYKAEEPIGSADQNYDSQSIEPTCNIQFSTAKMRYRLCHWIDYGRINVYEVKFIKEGTFINTQIPTTINDRISVEQIDKFVDSFKQKNTVGLPVTRYSTNGP